MTINLEQSRGENKAIPPKGMIEIHGKMAELAVPHYATPAQTQVLQYVADHYASIETQFEDGYMGVRYTHDVIKEDTIRLMNGDGREIAHHGWGVGGGESMTLEEFMTVFKPETPPHVTGVPISELPLHAYMDEIGEQKQSCIDDFTNPYIGDMRRGNATDHYSDIQWYLAGLVQYLRPALDAAFPEPQMPRVVADQSPYALTNSIPTILETFEWYRGRRLLRPTAWRYDVSFLEALAQMKDEMLGSIMRRNLQQFKGDPLEMLADDIARGLEASQANGIPMDAIMRPLGADERAARHTFALRIGDAPDLVITGPTDVRGFKNAIWAELVLVRGDNLVWEILAHGWKYKPHPAAKAKKK